jgi:hypothetical protein
MSVFAACNGEKYEIFAYAAAIFGATGRLGPEGAPSLLVQTRKAIMMEAGRVSRCTETAGKGFRPRAAHISTGLGAG